MPDQVREQQEVHRSSDARLKGSSNHLGAFSHARGNFYNVENQYDLPELEKEFHAQPGTDLWFLINFTKPFFNGSLRSKVEEYLKQHPEYRPRSFPNNN